MARPRSFDEARVAAAAEQVFWSQGFDQASIDDLEAATGLSRSSLYLAFGSKEGLFDASLAAYQSTVTESLFAPMETPEAGLADAAGFFEAVAVRFRRRGARRGCLMVNSIAERAGRDPAFSGTGSWYLQRVTAAFSNSLAGAGIDGDERQVRTQMLVAWTLGVWIAVRVDPRAAAQMCDSIAAEIRGWSIRDGEMGSSPGRTGELPVPGA
ncbi:MAG: TetR/AcrR family transcriptional regulator [Acidimicrobiales bacterium]